jgi:transaldolase/glucose-6-phosphate isomerase
MNPLRELSAVGHSIWLDYIRRGMTRRGELTQMIEADDLRGMTSNPSIFKQAIADSDDYADVLGDLVEDRSLSPKDIYERLAIVDIQEAADAMRQVYDATERKDGYVSFEVSPSLALDTEGTLEEARRLWAAVDRPNLMIKVPGTDAGLPAIQALLTEGINVNVTLIFSRVAYARILEAFWRGAEAHTAAGGDPRGLASVASFFVSRIDNEVDSRLARVASSSEGPARQHAERLAGKIAIANAKLAYAHYEREIRTPRAKALVAKGLRPQRLLWASTGTKNPKYSDVLYVDGLIGPDTVNTVPPKTLDAFRDHGTVGPTLTLDVDDAEADLKQLAELGVDLDDVTDGLLGAGVVAFEEAMDALLGAVADKRRRLVGSTVDRTSRDLPAALDAAVREAGAAWEESDSTRRLWNRDASLWTNSGEDAWLGWLDEVAHQRESIGELTAFAAAVADRDITHLLLLGMGGSSLCPDVLARTYAGRAAKGAPTLRIVDSTDPQQVREAQAAVDLPRTLVVVSSKSGTTLEPHVLLAHFWAQMQAAVGERAGDHFVAVTDPGSKLEALAKERGFWRIFPGKPDIGGRFSALSNFGMVPAAAMGLDVASFLDEAALMAGACADPSATENPGVALGLVMGVAAQRGRNKLTLVLSPTVTAFGAWVEQLVAESTGKHGQAIIPVDGEPVLAPRVYGDDRLFVHLRAASAPHAAQDRAVQALRDAGHPVVLLDLDDDWCLAQELMRWEIATAVAGAVMGLNPFDQPDVEASKIETRAVTEAYERGEALPEPTVLTREGGLTITADARNAAALAETVETGSLSPGSLLEAHLRRLGPGDYFALLAYVPMNDANIARLQRIREDVARTTGAATCLGFGPRFLHSTGQAYKGGTNEGVFLQITAAHADDLPIPDLRASFGVIEAAQAFGDLQVLADRGRRVLRVHLPEDHDAGLARLESVILDALHARGGAA